MNGLGGIVGQERAVDRLTAALAAGKAHHAYLFEGPDGVGRRATALAFAQAANCERLPGRGCGECTSCRKIDADAHPDVVRFAVFNDEGKVKDQTDRVRQVIATLGFPPHEGRARVVIVDPAHELNPTASNVLLKTLEEPPAGTHFVLVTTTASRLLVTIRSRCQRLVFQPLSDELIAQRLISVHGIDAGAAGAAARMAGGSLGRAIELASSEDLPQRRERVGRLLAAVRGRRIQGLLDGAGELSGDRDEALATLEMLWVSYHDAIVATTGRSESLSPAGREEAGSLAGRVPVSGLLRGLRAVDEATDAVRGYVSPQLALERLLFHLERAGAA